MTFLSDKRGQQGKYVEGGRSVAKFGFGYSTVERVCIIIMIIIHIREAICMITAIFPSLSREEKLLLTRYVHQRVKKQTKKEEKPQFVVEYTIEE